MKLVTPLLFIFFWCFCCELGRANGSSYYLGYYQNWKQGGPPSILLMTRESQPVSFSIEAPGVDYYRNGIITTNNEAIINLPINVVVTSHTEQKKGIYLNVSSNLVTVIGQNSQTSTSDTFLVLPTVHYANSYVYYGVSVAEGVASSSQAGQASSILIVGTEDHTAMKVKMTQAVTVTIGRTTTGLTRGRQYTFTINKLQTVYMKSAKDLTGTKIITDKPISMFSGHGCANVHKNQQYCDHLVEQVPPITSWGRTFYIAPLASRRSYTVKVLAAHDSTSVDVYCNNVKQAYTLDDGDFITRTLSNKEYCAIDSDKAILVAQLSHGQADDSSGGYGDPMMTLVPATIHYMDKFIFSTIRNTKAQLHYSHYVNIIVLKQYYHPDKIHVAEGYRNNSLSTSQWVPIKVNNVIEAYGTQIALTQGVVEVVHSDPAALMTTVAYGFARKFPEGYGHPGGLCVSKKISESPPVITTSSNSWVFNLSSNIYNLTLSCEAPGTSLYYWEKQSDNSSISTDRKFSSTLTLHNLKPHDAGNYRCVAMYNCNQRSYSNYSRLTINDLLVSPPVVVQHPTNMTVEVFATVYLKCQVKGYGKIAIQWKRVGLLLPATATSFTIAQLDGITSILKITRVTSYYKGSYYCVVSSDVGSVTSYPAYLDVNVPCPEIIQHPRNKTVLSAEDVSFNCLALSYGRLGYDWRKKDKSTLPPYRATSTFQIVDILQQSMLVNSLMIAKVQPTDEGWYCCVATNECGSTEHCAWLNVNIAPIIDKQPTSVVIAEGQTTVQVTSCIAIGEGPIYYQWEKYHSSSDSWIRPSHRVVNVYSPKLTFSMITENDEGMYHCIVSNDDGSVVSDNATVTVYGPPVINHISDEIVSFEGRKVVLTCIVTNDVDAVGQLRTVWYNSVGDQVKTEKGHTLTYNRTVSDTSQVESVLSFDPVNHTDHGEYTCRAFNHPHTFVESKTTLTVEYAPIVSLMPQSSLTAGVGDQVSIWCRAEGLPTPTVQWYKNDEIVNPNADMILQVMDVPTNSLHNTVYTCVARNSAGNMNHTMKVDTSVSVQKICPHLTNPENGEMFIIDAGRRAIYTCRPNYIISGSYSLECVNGKWNNSPPICKKLLCDVLEAD